MNRKSVVGVLLVCLLESHSALAAPKDPRRSALHNFAAVVGSEEISKQCNWLDEKEKIKNARNINILMEALSIEFNNIKLVQVYHEMGKDVAQTRYAECDDNAKKMMQAGIHRGNWWADRVYKDYVKLGYKFQTVTPTPDIETSND